MKNLFLWLQNPNNTVRFITLSLSVLWVLTILPAFAGDFKEAIKGTGGLAWNLLMFTVFIGLASKIWRGNRAIITLLPLRKYTGIFAFCIGFSHFLFFLFAAESVQKALSFIPGNYFLMFGAIALLGMLFPFLTSTLWAVKTLGPSAWKTIQRLTHLAFIFTTLHIAFVHFAKNGSIEGEAFFPLVLYVLGYAYVFWNKYTKNNT